MTRPFSVQTVLRMVPNSLLQQFFHTMGHGDFDPCWSKLKQREIDPMWLNRRDVFEKAQVIHRVEHMSWWRKRNDLPKNAPDKSPEAIATLERDISSLLKSQERGKGLHRRDAHTGEPRVLLRTPDDFVQNIIVHDDDGHLSPETFRQTLLVVFTYDPDEGSLELYAKLPKSLTGIRRRFAGQRFPSRTRAQFLQNETWLRSAYQR